MNTHLPVRLSNKWADRFLLVLNGENVVPNSLKKLLMVTNIILSSLVSIIILVLLTQIGISQPGSHWVTDTIQVL